MGGLSDDILNSITEAVFLLDTNLRILYANRAAEEDLSASARAVAGNRLVDVIPWLASYEETLRNAATGGRSAWLQSVTTPMGATWVRLAHASTTVPRPAWFSRSVRFFSRRPSGTMSPSSPWTA